MTAKQLFITSLVLLAPRLALAEPTPDLVLIPRDVAAAALNWVAEPNAGIAVKLYAALQACIQDNPNSGPTMRNGGDQCPAVTAAIEAREKQITDLQKQIAEAKTKEPK